MQQNIKQACQILGISEYTNKDEVKKAYRTLCKKYHPDRNPAPDAVKHYIEVQQAYDIITQAEQYVTPVSAAKPQTAYEVFYKNIKNNRSASNTKSTKTKILGGTTFDTKKYEELQQRNAQKRKIEKERARLQKEKERKQQEEIAARMKARKLPSEKEAERREKIAVQKEAERIAGIIERLMEL